MDDKVTKLKAELYDLHVEEARLKAKIRDKLKELYLLNKEGKSCQV